MAFNYLDLALAGAGAVAIASIIGTLRVQPPQSGPKRTSPTQVLETVIGYTQGQVDDPLLLDVNEVREFNNGAEILAFSPRGAWVVWEPALKQLQVINARTKNLEFQAWCGVSLPKPIVSIAGDEIAVVLHDKSINGFRFAHIDAYGELRTFALDTLTLPVDGLSGHTAPRNLTVGQLQIEAIHLSDEFTECDLVGWFDGKLYYIELDYDEQRLVFVHANECRRGEVHRAADGIFVSTATGVAVCDLLSEETPAPYVPDVLPIGLLHSHEHGNYVASVQSPELVLLYQIQDGGVPTLIERFRVLPGIRLLGFISATQLIWVSTDSTGLQHHMLYDIPESILYAVGPLLAVTAQINTSAMVWQHNGLALAYTLIEE